MENNDPQFCVRKIRLDNFRKFKTLNLDFDPRLTVIIADNAGGKTSVLDAIAIGLARLVREFASVDQRIEVEADIIDTDFLRHIESLNTKRKRMVTSDFAQVSIECDFYGQAYAWNVWKASHSGVLAPKLDDRDLNKLVDFSLKKLEPEYYKTPDFTGEFTISSLPSVVYYGARSSNFAIPQRIHGVDGDYGSPFSAYIGCLDSGGDIKEFLSWFDEAEAGELRMNKGSIADDYRADEALQAIRSALEAGLSATGNKIKNPRFEERPKRFCFDEILPDGSALELELTQLSAGYSRILTIIMDYARRLAIANQHTDMDPLKSPGVVLIDEIDLHLHSTWQQKVIKSLLEAFPNTQFILSTHSPQVISTVRKENIRILSQASSGKWEARAPEHNPYAHSNSLSLEAIMGGHAYPDLPLTANLREYQRLVGEDQHDSPRALELRGILENEWGKVDSELQLIDISIRKNETLRKFRQ